MDASRLTMKKLPVFVDTLDVQVNQNSLTFQWFEAFFSNSLTFPSLEKSKIIFPDGLGTLSIEGKYKKCSMDLWISFNILLNTTISLHYLHVFIIRSICFCSASNLCCNVDAHSVCSCFATLVPSHYIIYLFLSCVPSVFVLHQTFVVKLMPIVCGVVLLH